MIILLPPSKTFTSESNHSYTELIFNKENKTIESIIKNLSIGQIKTMMSVSDKIANETYNYYHLEHALTPAIYLYGGTVYKYLDPKNICFKNNQLYILDAYYGLLRATDGIKKYRLDFLMKLDINLYHFWKEKVNSYLLSHHKNELIIDLCSKEFSKILSDGLDILRIDFLHNDKKPSNMELKKLRGLMASILINKDIQSTDDIKKINIDGYSYQEDNSNNTIYIFKK